MLRDILVDSRAAEIRAAILEDGELVEIYIETTGEEKFFGNIYRGKIERVLPGMECAFVDIGAAKKAFLYAGDVLDDNNPNLFACETGKIPAQRIENLIKPGQEITVQVIKEAIETKGPRVTTNIILPGRNSVLTPFKAGIGVSKRINDMDERKRLKNIAEELCPDGLGLIIRTSAEGTESVEIENDIRILLKLWEKICQNETKGAVPRCIYREPGMIQKLARDSLNAGIHRFILNNRQEYEALVSFIEVIAPEMKTKIEYYQTDYDLFEYYHVETSLQRALSRKVRLKCGGNVIFDETEALTVVDVNTGKFIGKNDPEETVLKTNLEAAAVIAAQIRLRNISGIILIDFIDMKENSHREKVLSALREEVKRDRTKVVVIGMTQLGLVEMTRKKQRRSLKQTLMVPCPVCGGTGFSHSALWGWEHVTNPQKQASKISIKE